MHDNHLCMNDMIVLIKLKNGKMSGKIFFFKNLVI